MKAGLYIRVSSDRQAKEGESLGEQEKTLTNYCNFRNIEIINLYREEGKSAKNTNRPQFQKMIRDCKLGNIDTVIVKKVDRLSRSLMDFEKTMKFFEDQNINLISLNENFDTSTAIGRAVIRIILTFAQLEREQTSERTADVIQFRAEQGIWNGGKPPLGYNTDKKQGLIPNEKELEAIPVIFGKYLEFASYKKVAYYLNQSGFRPKNYYPEEPNNKTFNDTTVSRILKNTVYIGKIKHKGELYPGKHKACIPEDIFNKVQEIMKENDRGKSSSIKSTGTHNFILEKILKCGHCGAYMTPRWSRSKGMRYFYYECTQANHRGTDACETRPIRAASIESLILRRVCAIKKTDIMMDSLIQGNVGTLEKEIHNLESEKAVLSIRLTQASNRAQEIVDRLLSIRELTNSSILHDEINRLEKEKADISNRIQEIDQKITQYKNRTFNAGEIKDIFQYFSDIYGKLNKDDKRLLMKVIIKEIYYKQEQTTISYYTNIDIIKPSITSSLTWAEPHRPEPVWLRPTLSDINDPTRQTVTETFNINTYTGRNGKILLNYF